MIIRSLKFLPSIILMVTIYYLSSKPTDSVHLTGEVRYLFFKALHILVYMSLFFSYRFAGFTNKQGIILVAIYGVTDEFHQSFTPGRTPMATDVLYDTAGALLGLLLLPILTYSRNRYEKLAVSKRKK